ALLECSDRFLQRQPSAFQAFHHLGEALHDVLVARVVSHGSGLRGLGRLLCHGVHLDSFSFEDRRRVRYYSSSPSGAATEMTPASSSPSCNRTRTRSPGCTAPARSSA